MLEFCRIKNNKNEYVSTHVQINKTTENLNSSLLWIHKYAPNGPNPYDLIKQQAAENWIKLETTENFEFDTKDAFSSTFFIQWL